MPRLTYFYALLALLLPIAVLTFTEPVGPWVALAAFLLPAAAYAWGLTVGGRPGRMVWVLFLLVFLSAFQIVISYLFERSVVAVDMFLNLLTTNGGEAGEVLGQIWPSVVIVAVVYVPLLVLATRWGGTLSDRFRRGARRTALAAALAGALCAAMSLTTAEPLRPLVDVFPVNVLYNMGLAVGRTVAQTHYADNTAALRFGARSQRDSDTTEAYILVVGETARHDYMARTQVFRRPDVVSFGRAFTQSNTTHKSVPMLLSPLDARSFRQLPHTRGILAAFGEAGFHTAFVSNQKRNHSYIDFLARQADTVVYINDGAPTADYRLDGDMLPVVSSLLQKPYKKLFIVVHAYGQHFEYGARYTRRPTAAAGSRDPETLRHEYLLASRYMGSVVDSLIHLLEGRHCAAALLYTSDHGENLLDDSRKKFLHASPVPSYYELHIPLLVWTSAPFDRQHPRLKQQLLAHRPLPVENSASVFPTMLALAGIEAPARGDSLALCLPAYRAPEPLVYLDDHNAPRTLQAMHLDPEDYHKIDSVNRRCN